MTSPQEKNFETSSVEANRPVHQYSDNGASVFTPGPWFVSGVRFRMNGGEWHNVSRYDEAKKQDEHIACVGFDPRTGLGLADARLIAAAPDMLAALQMVRELDDTYGIDFTEQQRDQLHDAIRKASGAQS
jgi:hypothetical protein